MNDSEIPQVPQATQLPSDFCAELARGDFSSLVQPFEQAGFDVHLPLEGTLQICARNSESLSTVGRLRLCISVGVHGDETAPIEVMAQLLAELVQTPYHLAVDLLVVVGNITAIQQVKRFIDVDLNRLFTPQRTQFNDSKEATRADQLMQLTEQFFSEHKLKWHLDLHTAIRASVYPTFAIVPGKPTSGFLLWLGKAGIQAVVLNPQATVTFSSYTSQYLGATSCTAELGRIGEMGKNELTQFRQTQQAIDRLLRTGNRETGLHNEAEPLVFRVAQELIKRSDAFQLTFDSQTQNFTQFAPDTLIATDGTDSYRVGLEPEYILFPNPTVRNGLRAGLLVVKTNLE